MYDSHTLSSQLIDEKIPIVFIRYGSRRFGMKTLDESVLR